MRTRDEAALAAEPDMIPLRRYCKRVGQSYTKCYEGARRDELLVPVFKSGSRWVVSRIALEEILNRQHDAVQREAVA